VCSRPTANTVFMSRQLSEGKKETKQRVRGLLDWSVLRGS
jgi:hypothetical protein